MMKRAFVVLIAVCGLAGPALAQQDAPGVEFGAYHALVIGNDAYPNLNNLQTAVADAEAVAEVLETRYGFAVERLINATRYDMVSALGRLRARLGETDNVLIYYAGHGILDEDSDEGYWLPVDAESDNLANWVSNGTITSQLKAFRARHVLVVADSCYSGTLTRAVDPGLRTGVTDGEWLRRMASRRSRTALTSGGLEPVADLGGGGHSVFARAFLDVLRGNNHVIDGQSMFDALKQAVVVNAEQTPAYAIIRKADHDGGDFLFVPIVAAGTALAEAPSSAPATTMLRADESVIELTFWQSIQGSREAEDYQAYLDRFPEGTFAPLAKVRLRRLGAAAEKAPEATPETVAGPDVVEAAFWQSAEAGNEAADYEAYLAQYPDGHFTVLARARLTALQTAQAEAVQTTPAPAPESETTVALATPGGADTLQTTAQSASPAQPPEGVGRFDGVWEGKIVAHEFIRSGTPIRADVVGNVFTMSVNLKARGRRIRSELQGSISREGELFARSRFSGTGRWRVRTIELTVQFADASASGRLNLGSGNGRILLRRVSTPAAVAALFAQETAVAGEPVQSGNSQIALLAGSLLKADGASLTEEAKEKLRPVIKEYYNNSHNMKLIAGKYRSTVMESIHSLDVFRDSGGRMTLEVTYRWRVADSTRGKTTHAVVTLEHDGSSYRVVDFE